MTMNKFMLIAAFGLVVGAKGAAAELIIAGVSIDLGMAKAAIVQQYREGGVTLEVLQGMSDTFCVRPKGKTSCEGLLTFKEEKLEIASLYWRSVDEKNTAPELAALLVALVAQCSQGRGGAAQVSLNTTHSEVGRFETIRLQYGELECGLQLVEQPDGGRYVNLKQTISSRKENPR